MRNTNEVVEVAQGGLVKFNTPPMIDKITQTLLNHFGVQTVKGLLCTNKLKY